MGEIFPRGGRGKDTPGREAAVRRMNPLAALVASVLAGSLAVPATAHHSTAMFDKSTELESHGTVVSFKWTNPHSWLYIETKGANGAASVDGYELGSPNTMVRKGWKASSFKTGDEIDFLYSPRHDRSGGGLMIAARRTDGTWLEWLPRAVRARELSRDQ